MAHRRARRAARVWFNFMDDKKNAGKTLVKLLKDTKVSSTRGRIISGLNCNYVAEAEKTSTAIMRDDKDPDQFQAAKILSWHCGKKYGPTLIDRVADKKQKS